MSQAQKIDGDKNLGSVVAKGASINLLGEFLDVLGAPLLFLFVSRVLGAQTLGTYILVSTYIALFFRIGVMGLDKGTLRFVSLSLSSKDSVREMSSTLGTALKWTICVSVLITAAVALFPQPFLSLGGDESSTDALWWLSAMVLALPAQTLTRVMLFAIRGLSVMWAFVIVNNVILPVTLLLASLLPLAFGFSERALAFGFVFSAGFTLLITVIIFFRLFSKQSFWSVVRAKNNLKLIQFSFPQGLTETLNFLLARIDIIMVAAFFPERPELVAFYGLASLVAGLVKKVKNSFDNSFSPVFASLHKAGDLHAMQTHFKEVGRWIFTLFMLLSGAISLYSHLILGIFGPEYTKYFLAVPILIAGRFFNAAGGPTQAALLMSGRSKLEFVNNVFINLTNVGLNLILIPKYHIFGAAIATSISLTLFNLIRIVEVSYLLKVKVDPVSIIRITAAGGVAAIPGISILLIMPATIWLSAVSGSLFIILYPFVLMGFGGGSDIKKAFSILIKYTNKRRSSNSH